MKPTYRWLLLGPMVIAGFLAVGGLYWLAHLFLLWVCPASLQSVEGTTDLAERDYGMVVSMCSASWYPSAGATLLRVTLLLAIAACTAIAYFVAPARKLLVSVVSGTIVAAVLALAFF